MAGPREKVSAAVRTMKAKLSLALSGRARESRRILMSSTRYLTYRFFVVKGHGASVVITYGSGREETWVGFATREEAEAWVAKKMAKRPENKNGKPAPE
jgi:hypothetical protein